VTELKGTRKMSNIRSDYLMYCCILLTDQRGYLMSSKWFLSICVQNFIVLHMDIIISFCDNKERKKPSCIKHITKKFYRHI